LNVVTVYILLAPPQIFPKKNKYNISGNNEVKTLSKICLSAYKIV